jgi:hypothetical protein
MIQSANAIVVRVAFFDCRESSHKEIVRTANLLLPNHGDSAGDSARNMGIVAVRGAGKPGAWFSRTVTHL